MAPPRAIEAQPETCRRASWNRRLDWAADAPRPLVEALWGDPDALVAAGAMLKRGRGTTVVRIDGAAPVVVKRYNLRNWRRTLSHLLLPSRAARSWMGAERLTEAGVATPRPLARCEERACSWFKLRSFFVYAHLPAETLDQRLRRPGIGPEEVEAVCEEMRRVARRLRKARLTHGDGKPANYLWREGRLWLIDVDGVRRHRTEGSWQRARAREVKRLLQDFQDEPHLFGPLSQAAQGA